MKRVQSDCTRIIKRSPGFGLSYLGKQYNAQEGTNELRCKIYLTAFQYTTYRDGCQSFILLIRYYSILFPLTECSYIYWENMIK